MIQSKQCEKLQVVGHEEERSMRKKKIVIALGHDALGTTLPEQKAAAKKTARAVADLIESEYQVVISHSNGPQVGMILGRGTFRRRDDDA